MRILFFLSVILFVSCQQKTSVSVTLNNFREDYRPQFHFSPLSGWMNDPNGLVYFDGEYHLFYQHYPDSTIWGPMHWGHAVSTDMINWKNLPIALFPDSLGYIFSGSAVADLDNTSGLANEGDTALVALFTYHNPEINGIGSQYQGIAYSIDKGRTWIKYTNNPVLQNPGLPDFRDPKVMWYHPTAKWIMTLAVGDHIRFYSSPDLKKWELESEFGKHLGAHGGVWECPDLFEMPVSNGNQKKWVLLVSINPGAPNGGSGTQYFIGSFDGHQFIWEEDEVKWIDYGMDNYAGVTWSNSGSRKLFIGWMSNWLYAQKVPTHPWRSAMTVPRELSLLQHEKGYLLHSVPVPELEMLDSMIMAKTNIGVDSVGERMNIPVCCKIELKASLQNSEKLQIEIGNKRGQKVEIGYNKISGEIYVDRVRSGITRFDSTFAAKLHRAVTEPGLTDVKMILLLDRSSVEFFFNGGSYVMTDQVFPEEPYDYLRLYTSEGEARIDSLMIHSVKSIWE